MDRDLVGCDGIATIWTYTLTQRELPAGYDPARRVPKERRGCRSG